MSEEGGAEFVTIAEAAAALGISVRQAQRDARHLSDSDRHIPDKGATRVRLAALAALRSQAIPDQSMSDNGRHEATQAGQNDATWRDINATVSDTRGELIEELRASIERLERERQAADRRHEAEVERLNAALERAQGAHIEALRALRAEQDRTAQLEHLQTRLIEALPAPVRAADEAQEIGAQNQVTNTAEAVPAAKLSFWERLWRKKKA